MPGGTDPILFHVRIPATGVPVDFDLTGRAVISSLTLDGNATLRPLAATSLMVSGAAVLAGTLDAVGGALRAVGPATRFEGTSARVQALDKARLAIAAPSYTSTGLVYSDGAPGDIVSTFTTSLFSASGNGTVVDLSALKTIDAGFAPVGNDVNRHEISVGRGARLLLSGLETVKAPVAYDDWIRFSVSESPRCVECHVANTELRLDSLATIGSAGRGRTRFDLGGRAAIALPKLTEVAQADFQLNGGSTVTAGPVATVTDSRFAAAGSSRLSVAGAGATYSSKGLVFDDRLAAGPASTFVTRLFSAKGAGSALDLAALELIDAGFGRTGNDINRQEVRASAGGVIDLSGVRTIIGPVATGDRVSFTASGAGSLIDLGGLELPRSAGAGSLSFCATAGGHIELGPVSVTTPGFTLTAGAGSTLRVGGDLVRAAGGRANVSLAGAGDRLEVAGTLDLGSGIRLVAGDGAVLAVAGDLRHAHVSSARLQLERAVLRMSGPDSAPGPQTIEVGGLDVGTFVDQLADGNFGVGQLVLGEAGIATTVRLVDWRDNGHRGTAGAAEALYLFGRGGSDGLQLRGGSTLLLEGLPAYALVGGTMVSLYSLFPAEALTVAFGDGFLARPAPAASGITSTVPEPATWALVLAGLALVHGLRARRRSSREGRPRHEGLDASPPGVT